MRTTPKIKVDEPAKKGALTHPDDVGRFSIVAAKELHGDEYVSAVAIIALAYSGIMQEDDGEGIASVYPCLDAAAPWIEISPRNGHADEVHALACRHIVAAIELFQYTAEDKAKTVEAPEPWFTVDSLDRIKPAVMKEASR